MDNKLMRLIGAAITLTGLLFVFKFGGPYVALGVFLAMWGNNMVLIFRYGIKMYKCKKCGYMTPSNQLFNVHMRGHGINQSTIIINNTIESTEFTGSSCSPECSSESSDSGSQDFGGGDFGGGGASGEW